jgi:hypothetical protein
MIAWSLNERDERFLINTDLDSAAAPITLLIHWHPAV